MSRHVVEDLPKDLLIYIVCSTVINIFEVMTISRMLSHTIIRTFGKKDIFHYIVLKENISRMLLFVVDMQMLSILLLTEICRFFISMLL